jgi:hypothetical protein
MGNFSLCHRSSNTTACTYQANKIRQLSIPILDYENHYCSGLDDRRWIGLPLVSGIMDIFCGTRSLSNVKPSCRARVVCHHIPSADRDTGHFHHRYFPDIPLALSGGSCEGQTWHAGMATCRRGGQEVYYRLTVKAEGLTSLPVNWCTEE